MVVALTTDSDSLIGKTILIEGRPWTIAAPFEGIGYHYLVNPDEEEPIIRADALLHAAIYRFESEVDPNNY